MASGLRRRLLPPAFLLAALAGTCPALALDDGDKEAIRSLSNQAASDYESGRYDDALHKFLRAYDTAKVPRLAVWAARAHVRLGHLVAAYELYRQALSLRPNDLWQGDAQQTAQRDAEAELSALQPRIPRVTVVVAGADSQEVAVKIDGTDVPRALLGVERLADPGMREVVGTRRGQVVREKITLAEGAKERVTLRFGPANQGTSDAPSPSGAPVTAQVEPSRERSGGQRTWGWIGLGVGAAGLAVGLTTGVMVATKYGDLNKKCPDRACDPSQASDVDSYNALRTVSTVGLLVGGVGAAVGVTLLLTSPKRSPAARVWLSPTSTGISGAF
jgi:hypothetical protein